MSIALWIVQGLLALLFVITGSFKFFQSREKVIESGGKWAEDYKSGVVKTIAGIELASAILLIVGLIVHGLYLTFIGATCIGMIMAGAIYTHIKRKEFQHAMINCIFLLMALFVIYAEQAVWGQG